MIIDLHVHTKEVSACGKVGIERIIDLYAEKGYDAITVTNHLNNWTRGDEIARNDYSSFIDFFIEPVKIGREYAKKYGMSVFFGCELRFEDDPNDFLVYGITEEYLKNTPDIRRMDIKRLKSEADENGFLIYQAHPFRDDMKITPVSYLHGIEVNNGHPRHNSRNDIARLWADIHGLSMVSGSDFHEEGDEAHGGIVTFRDVHSESELCDVLLKGEYKLICDCFGGIKR